MEPPVNTCTTPKRRRDDIRVCEVGDCDHLVLCHSFPKDKTLSNAWRRFVRNNHVSLLVTYLIFFRLANNFNQGVLLASINDNE